MNICILKESLDIGGTERSAANVSRVLEKEHNVYLALFDASFVKYKYGGELIDFCLGAKKTFLGKVFNTIERDIKLRKLLKRKKVDVLYAFTGIGNKQTKYKYRPIKIISARDFGAMKESHDQYRAALMNSDAMICNSEYTKNFYVTHYPNHENKVFAVYNYIDVHDIRIQAEESVEKEFLDFISNHGKTVVSCGRFCKEKGFEHLIRAIAFQNDEDIGLVLVGDGEYKERYMRIIKEKNIEKHVYFTGFQKNPYKYMSRCSCFVLSSISEGFPNVLAEAMALGLPVISTNCRSGPAEILRKDNDYLAVTTEYKNCDFGIMTPGFDEENISLATTQLGMAISVLLSKDDLMKHYAEQSKQRVEAFSEETMRKRLNDIFAELISRRGKHDKNKK